MIFQQPPSNDVASGVKRLVEDLNRFHQPISRLPVLTDDVAAANAGLKVGYPYVTPDGFVRRRMG